MVCSNQELIDLDNAIIAAGDAYNCLGLPEFSLGGGLVRCVGSFATYAETKDRRDDLTVEGHDIARTIEQQTTVAHAYYAGMWPRQDQAGFYEVSAPFRPEGATATGSFYDIATSIFDNKQNGPYRRYTRTNFGDGSSLYYHTLGDSGERKVQIYATDSTQITPANITLPNGDRQLEIAYAGPAELLLPPGFCYRLGPSGIYASPEDATFAPINIPNDYEPPITDSLPIMTRSMVAERHRSETNLAFGPTISPELTLRLAQLAIPWHDATEKFLETAGAEIRQRLSVSGLRPEPEQLKLLARSAITECLGTQRITHKASGYPGVTERVQTVRQSIINHPALVLAPDFRSN
ncbi:MAG TPA: hypothetical protein VMR45_04895 [Patescibacteria group bacterium]|nr:hypothetical protein [Patescibacteria group bacterium]